MQILTRILEHLRYAFSHLTYYGAYRNAMNRLEERSALEELGYMTATLEHDLRSPLAAMDNRIDRMKDRFKHERGLIDSLSELEFHLERMRHSLALIPLFRGDVASFQRFMRKTDAMALINAAIKDLKRELSLSETIRFRLDDRKVFVRADPRMFLQAIICVLKNSIEAIQEAKRERGLISVKLNRSMELAVLEITDDGCGMSSENIPRMGPLFTSKDYGGVNRGLGVFMVGRIVDLHGGSISIRSEYGKGTTVSLTLPLWIDR